MFDISKNLIGFEDILATIKNNFINKSLPNSLIFYGNKGIGKKTFSYSLINDLLNNRGEERVVDIATHLGITQATASKTIQRLQKQGYLEKLPYRSIFLTPKGQAIAYRSKKRHNTVYNFLIKLGVSKKIAKKDAEGIEHHVSGETLNKFKRFYKKVK